MTAVHTSIVVHMLACRVSHGVYTPPALLRKDAEETRM
jgi:hypothetical protein